MNRKPRGSTQSPLRRALFMGERMWPHVRGSSRYWRSMFQAWPFTAVGFRPKCKQQPMASAMTTRSHSELVFCPYTDEYFSPWRFVKFTSLIGDSISLEANLTWGLIRETDPIKSLTVKRIKPTWESGQEKANYLLPGDIFHCFLCICFIAFYLLWSLYQTLSL